MVASSIIQICTRCVFAFVLVGLNSLLSGCQPAEKLEQEDHGTATMEAKANESRSDKELAPPSPEYPITRLFQYSFTASNTSNQLLENVELRVFAPVKQTATQQVKSITSSIPHQLEVDKLGNQQLVVKLEKVAPFQSVVVSVRVELALTDSPNKLSYDPQFFLNDERFIEVSNRLIQEQAKKFHSLNKWETSKKIYQWVSSELQDRGYMEDDRGALFALQNKFGDCSEFSYLTVALARANDIPARVVNGYIMESSGTIQSMDYHAWAELFVDGAWRPVDALLKEFNLNASRYITTGINSENLKEMLDVTKRFDSSSSLMQISMK